MEALTREFEGWMLGAISHDWVWRALVGIGIAIAGYYLARMLARMIDRLMLRFHVDEIMRSFLRMILSTWKRSISRSIILASMRAR